MNTKKLDLEIRNLGQSANALDSYLSEIKRDYYENRPDKELFRKKIARLRNQRFSMLGIHGVEPTKNEIEGWKELIKSLLEDK